MAYQNEKYHQKISLGQKASAGECFRTFLNLCCSGLGKVFLIQLLIISSFSFSKVPRNHTQLHFPYLCTHILFCNSKAAKTLCSYCSYWNAKISSALAYHSSSTLSTQQLTACEEGLYFLASIMLNHRELTVLYATFLYSNGKRFLPTLDCALLILNDSPTDIEWSYFGIKGGITEIRCVFRTFFSPGFPEYPTNHHKGLILHRVHQDSKRTIFPCVFSSKHVFRNRNSITENRIALLVWLSVSPCHTLSGRVFSQLFKNFTGMIRQMFP